MYKQGINSTKLSKIFWNCYAVNKIILYYIKSRRIFNFYNKEITFQPGKEFMCALNSVKKIKSEMIPS